MLPVKNRSPDLVVPPQVHQQRPCCRQHVAEIGRQHHGPQNWVKRADAEDVHHAGGKESACGKRNAAQHERLPDAPRKLVGEIRHGAESQRIPRRQGVTSQSPQHNQQQPAEHRRNPLRKLSARQEPARKRRGAHHDEHADGAEQCKNPVELVHGCSVPVRVLQRTTALRIRPTPMTTNGRFDIAFHVNAGKGSFGKPRGNPTSSGAVSDR